MIIHARLLVTHDRPSSGHTQDDVPLRTNNQVGLKLTAYVAFDTISVVSISRQFWLLCRDERSPEEGSLTNLLE